MHLVLQYLTIISISHIRPPCHKLCIALQFQNSLLARNSFVQKVDFSYSSVLGQKTKNIRSTRIWKNQSSVLNCTRIYPDKLLIKSRIRKSYKKAKLISHKKFCFSVLCTFLGHLYRLFSVPQLLYTTFNLTTRFTRPIH